MACAHHRRSYSYTAYCPAKSRAADHSRGDCGRLDRRSYARRCSAISRKTTWAATGQTGGRPGAAPSAPMEGATVPGMTPHQARVGWAGGGAAAVAITAVSAAAWPAGSSDPVFVVVGMLIVTVIAGGWTASVVHGEPSPSVDLGEGVERVSDMVERGMGDLGRYLDRHAAFAAYLEHHGTEHPSVGAGTDDVTESRQPGGWRGRLGTHERPR
jgi:hypothetical protein